MSRNRVIVLRDASIAPYDDDNRIHLQWCRFDIDTYSEYGYRYMWSNQRGLKPLRGGARIPSWSVMNELMEIADREGWSNQDERNT